MNAENRKKLIARYLKNSASEDEVRVFFEEMKDDSFVNLVHSFDEQPIPIYRKLRKISKYWISAASILLIFGGGLYLLTSRDISFTSNKSAFEQYMPAKNKAIMKIDGQIMASLADSSEYVDQILSLSHDKDIQYITVETQDANTFRMALPDGSLVYLNAGTKLKFPKEFTNGERKVEVDGEAYFEVVADVDRPFMVSTHGKYQGTHRNMDVTVTGTKFLVSNYQDLTSAHTVLLEGVVSVNNERMAPGYIYELSEGREAISRPSSLSKYTDWIDGVFELDGEPISTILYKIEKWYGVRFIGKKTFKNQNFGGVISRNVPLKDILSLLEENAGLKFKEADNNQIIIL